MDDEGKRLIELEKERARLKDLILRRQVSTWVLAVLVIAWAWGIFFSPTDATLFILSPIVGVAAFVAIFVRSDYGPVRRHERRIEELEAQEKSAADQDRAEAAKKRRKKAAAKKKRESGQN